MKITDEQARQVYFFTVLIDVLVGKQGGARGYKKGTGLKTWCQFRAARQESKNDEAVLAEAPGVPPTLM